jgi:MFS family permease
VLHLLVFVSGMTVLGCQLAASRLFAPYFGTSLLIWANMIGLMLLFLTVGYWLGGRLADRYPNRESLYHATAVAAVFIGIIPVFAGPILHLTSVGFAGNAPGIFWGSLIGVAVLYSAPITLLGCVSPWSIRLSVADVRDAGRTAGGLYALSTAGSLLGAYLPVLVLIPGVGTHRTFFLLSIGLLVVSLVGLARERRAADAASTAVMAGVRVPLRVARRRGAVLGAYAAALALIAALAVLPGGLL